jgi:hypothetical protein
MCGMILRVLRRRIVIIMCMLLTIGSAGSSNAQDPEHIFKQFFEVIKEIQRHKELRDQNHSQPSPPISASPAVPFFRLIGSGRSPACQATTVRATPSAS